jgi:hypothetical protein
MLLCRSGKAWVSRAAREPWGDDACMFMCICSAGSACKVVCVVQGYEQKLAAEDKQFAEFKKSYDRERETTTRTTYEVDFANYFTKLANLGAKFNSDAYLHTVRTYKLQ